MQRDLFITLDFPPARGGVATYYPELLRVLKERRLFVLAPEQSERKGIGDHVEVRPSRLLGPRWLWTRWFPLLWPAFRALRRERSSFIHVGQLLPVGTVALLLRRWIGTPYIVYVHGLDIVRALHHPRRRRLAHSILSHASLIVANSEDTHRRLESFGVRNDRVRVVRPGTSQRGPKLSHEVRERFREEHHANGKTVVLSLTRLVPRKGLATSLRAFAQVAEAHPSVVYWIVGDGPERPSLERIAREEGLQTVLPFSALCPMMLFPRSIPQLIYSFSPTALGGSDIEGFGIVYLEAASFGLPSIGSRTGGVPEAIRDEVTGLLVPPDDEAPTAKALSRLVTDTDLSRRLGEQGKIYAATEAQWSVRVRPLLEWFSSQTPCT